ncbi:MAG: PKD domain-containing protein, partial [Bacteroidia bacterium]
DPIISWAWDFGDPSVIPPNSNNQNVSATFPNPGTYPVSLIVVTQTGCTDTFTINNAVRVGTPPVEDFTADKDTVCINEFITFTSVVQDPGWEYYWDFGYTPPGSFTLFDTVATTIYPDTGLFSVALIVDDNGCRDTIIKNDFVFVSPPRAEFSVSDSVVCTIPSTISIQDLSLGPADVYEWRLNGNVYSNLQNPPDLVITNVGSYILSQIIENSISGCRDTFSVVINAGDPVANFTVTDSAGCAPLTLQYFNLSQNATAYAWRFNYPSGVPNSVNLHPPHTYNQPGFYSVRLIVSDQFGCRDTIIKTNYIDAWGPTVDFSATPQGGCPPLAVQFTDLTTTTSSTTPMLWEWDFGDNSPVSTQQNPNHLYTAAGSYTVKLKVTDDQGCVDSLEIPNFVNVTFPVPSFTVADDSTCAGNLVSFLNTSQGTGMTFQWDFGDGIGTSTLASPTYAYSDTGHYDVKLIATDVNGCVDSITIPNVVYIEQFEANFAGDPITGICPPLNTQFSDSTIGNVVAWTWTFGDGFGISQLQNPAYVYFQPGSFDVTLVATHEDGCQDTVTKANYVQLAGPNGIFVVDPLNVCLGDSICITAVTTGAIMATIDYRDGNVDTRTNLSGLTDTIYSCHLYENPGRFSPVIVLEDAQGCVFTLTSSDTTTVYSLPNAGISPLDTVGCLPFTLSLFDTSIPGDSAISTWIWDLGDGSTSSLQNPVHTYLIDSTYQVKLMITDINGCVDSVETSLTAVQGIIGDFEASDTMGCAPIDISFTDLSTNGPATDWTWIFGDGNMLNGVANPTHPYMNDGLFDVTFIVYDALGCTDTVVKPAYIDLRHPEAHIYSNITQGCNPLIVTYYGDSSVSNSPILQYEWCLTDLGTGQTTCQTTTIDSIDINFPDPGNFR